VPEQGTPSKLIFDGAASRHALQYSCLSQWISVGFFHQNQFEIFLIFLVSVNPYDASCDEFVRATNRHVQRKVALRNATSSGVIG